MKSIRNASFLKALLLLAGAIGSAALPAHAQSAKGTFTLAHQARWGTAILPAGSYAFSVYSENWPARVTVHEIGGSTSAIVLPLAFTSENIGSGSTLVLHHEGGDAVVTRLCLASIGMALEFSPGKVPARAETATLGPITDSRPGK